MPAELLCSMTVTRYYQGMNSYEKVQFSVWNEEKTALLTETEDGSAALYALPGENLDGGVLLRWDDTLVKFLRRYATNYRAEPKLWLRDMDGDRTKELVVSCQIGGGTGVNYEELHVVKKTENGNRPSTPISWAVRAATRCSAPKPEPSSTTGRASTCRPARHF